MRVTGASAGKGVATAAEEALLGTDTTGGGVGTGGASAFLCGIGTRGPLALGDVSGSNNEVSSSDGSSTSSTSTARFAPFLSVLDLRTLERCSPQTLALHTKQVTKRPHTKKKVVDNLAQVTGHNRNKESMRREQAQLQAKSKEESGRSHNWVTHPQLPNSQSGKFSLCSHNCSTCLRGPGHANLNKHMSSCTAKTNQAKAL